MTTEKCFNIWINFTLKGTVRPDLICMTVVLLEVLERTSIALGFGFFHFSFEYLKRLQSSEPLHTKMNPPSCLFGSWFVQNTFFLLAGALLLFWFGLQECWNSSNILLMSRKPKSRFVLIQTVIRTSRRLGSFLYEAAQNFEVFLKIQN